MMVPGYDQGNWTDSDFEWDTAGDSGDTLDWNDDYDPDALREDGIDPDELPY